MFWPGKSPEKFQGPLPACGPPFCHLEWPVSWPVPSTAHQKPPAGPRLNLRGVFFKNETAQSRKMLVFFFALCRQNRPRLHSWAGGRVLAGLEVQGDGRQVQCTHTRVFRVIVKKNTSMPVHRVDHPHIIICRRVAAFLCMERCRDGTCTCTFAPKDALAVAARCWDY